MSGCAVQPDGSDAEVGTAADSLITLNTITLNTITLNTITASTITRAPLSTAGLDRATMTGLQDPTSVGAANRTVFHYLATCALAPTQSVSYAWTDAEGTHQVTEQGSLGLAPEWATHTLERQGQQLVSACVAARVNYFGVTVQISARSRALAADTSAAELAEFPYVEGAFWGNLFTSTPYLNSCYDRANVAHSRADQRECAAGYLDANGQVLSCGWMRITGPCDEQCADFDSAGQFYSGCGTAGESVITIGLQ